MKIPLIKYQMNRDRIAKKKRAYDVLSFYRKASYFNFL